MIHGVSSAAQYIQRHLTGIGALVLRPRVFIGLLLWLFIAQQKTTKKNNTSISVGTVVEVGGVLLSPRGHSQATAIWFPQSG